MKKYRKIIIIALLIIIPIRWCTHHRRPKHTEIAIDTSNVVVDLSGYNITSEPIGVGEYRISTNSGIVYSSNIPHLSVSVKKNTNAPWSGKAVIEWEMFDENNVSIGKAVGESDSMREGMNSSVSVSFSINDKGKLIYNQTEIRKIVLVQITEKDALHDDLQSSYSSKLYHLKESLENRNSVDFYTRLNAMLVEYTEDEFPEQANELKLLSEEAKKIFGSQDSQLSTKAKETNKDSAPATPAPTLKPTATPKPTATQKSITTAKPAQPKAEQPKQNAENNRKSYIGSCAELSSYDLSRNPSAYKNKPVYVCGTVVSQVAVQKGKVESALEAIGVIDYSDYEIVKIEDGYGEIAIVYSPSEFGRRLLDGDYVHIYGDSLGMTEMSQMNAFGTTTNYKIPEIRARYTI